MMLSIPFGFRDALLIITAVSPTFAQYGPMSAATVTTVGLSTSTVWSFNGYDGASTPSTPSSPGSVSLAATLSTTVTSIILTSANLTTEATGPLNWTVTTSATGNASIPLSSITDAPTSTEDGEQSTASDSTTTPTSSQSGAADLACPLKNVAINLAVLMAVLAGLLI